MSEYNVLKGLGHGCGHNLICASSCETAIALSKALEGREAYVYVIGTPAEDTKGGKIQWLSRGF